MVIRPLRELERELLSTEVLGLIEATSKAGFGVGWAMQSAAVPMTYAKAIRGITNKTQFEGRWLATVLAAALPETAPN
jgi:hypothetical protein